MRRVLRFPRAINWLSAALVGVVLYILSFGPACWIAMRLDTFKHPEVLNVLHNAYFPVFIAVAESPPATHRLVEGYLRLGAPQHVTGVYVFDKAIVWCIPRWSITLFSM